MTENNTKNEPTATAEEIQAETNRLIIRWLKPGPFWTGMDLGIGMALSFALIYGIFWGISLGFAAMMAK